ncbi:MAG TPA: LacI family DNA-binding transcriptional regulator [Terracidiphilus sp.]|nr:LacI family DNA-binding transcriptional regulator [Terracidiphilus sp.]
MSEASGNPNPIKTRPRERVPAAHRKPTMSDVARLAGVGTMTVSRVLSGTVRVSAETAQRVNTAIEQLKYRPNELARAFRGQRSHSIGLIIPYLYDPFFANCAHAVTTVAKEHGYSVIITTSNENPETEFAEAEHMLERHVDGMVVIPSPFRQTRLSRALFGKTPVVAFDRPVPDPSLDMVLVQNTLGARRIVEHLIEEHGHKRIAYMALSRSLFTINTRFLGYRRAMQDAGLEVDAVFDCNNDEVTLRALKEKLSGKDAPTAILTSNTLATRYVLGAIAHLGVRVPNDIAFAGFDDFDLAEFTSPPLTVVRQPAQEMGRVATNLLFDRIARGEIPYTGNRIVLPVEIVLRRSCGCKHKTPVIMS